MNKTSMPATFELDKGQLRAAFERAARTYDAAARLQREIADELLARCDAIRFTPRRIVDVGCGTGYTSRAAARRFPGAQIVGLDIAAAMVRHARAQTSWLGRLRGNPGYVCADAERLPLAPASADLIVSNLTLQWCAPARAFAEFLRVLRPGGLLLFTSFGPDTLKELRAAWSAVDDRPHVHPFVDMHDLGDELLRTGFSDPVLDVERRVLAYREVREVMRELKRLGAHNVAATRARGLTGKQRFARVEAAYPRTAGDATVRATYEIVFGLAWASAKRDEERGARGEEWQPISVVKQTDG